MSTFAHSRNSHAAIVGVIVALVAMSVRPLAAAEITLRSQAVPRGAVVRLGDVADVWAEDRREAQRLAALPLMPAPAAGTQRFLRIREVEDLLTAHGEDLRELTFQGETAVAVAAPASGEASDGDFVGRSELRRSAWLGIPASAESIPLSDAEADRLREQFKTLIVEHLERSSGRSAAWQVAFQVSKKTLSSIPSAGTSASAIPELKCSGGVAPWTGKQRFVISYVSPRGESKFPVFADVTLLQTVVVAARPIERGAIVTAADVELAQWEHAVPSTGRRTLMESVEQLIGLEAARAIQAGEVILSDAVRPEMLVKRGDEVTVIARGGGIRVRTIARARQDGARGEPVQVESLETRERYDAVVTGQREATVFAGNAAPLTSVVNRPDRLPQR